MANNFNGFQKEGLDFLKQLEENNNREWFMNHKTDYSQFLLSPAQLFTADLGEKIQEISPQIQFDLRTNGSGSILRIHRDIRFSKDKSPYHTNLRILFWEGNLKKTENPGIFISIDKDGAHIYIGKYYFDSSHLKTFRESVVDELLGSQLVRAVNQVKRNGNYEIGGKHYKRVPSGFDRDHPRAEYLKFKGLYAHSRTIGPETLQSPAFVEVCFTEIKNMLPIHKWLLSIWKLSLP